MKEVLDKHPHVVGYAERAIEACGLPVRKAKIRGGTDGSKLSYMGLPCPNIFAGEHAFHSPYEFVSLTGYGERDRCHREAARTCGY
jgi:tripeptide aminopeptidase